MIRNVSFGQQSSISGNNVELIFVPAYSVAGFWQGTVIANWYDDYGNFIDQYIAESELYTPDPSNYSWDESYEAPVYGGVVQEPIYEPGMRTELMESYQVSIQQKQMNDHAERVSANTWHNARIVKAGFRQGWRARVRSWARCSFAWCGGAGITCVAVNIWNAELLAGPCFAIGCGTSAIGCTWGTIWQ